MSKIIKKLDRLDHSLHQLLEKLKDYEDHDLLRTPQSNVWSPMEVMQHLVASEQLSLQYLNHKLSQMSDNPLLKSGMRSALRAQLLSAYLRSPLKFSAPSQVQQFANAESSTFWELARAWRQNRKELRQFITSLPPEQRRLLWYKHPRVGRLSLYGMLTFYQDHFRRHQKQILRRLPF